MKKLLTIATAFFFSACIGVSAIESTYAYRDTGSISIELEQGEEGTSVSNVEFELIKVADINDGLYEFTEEMENEDIDLNKIETSEELQETAIVLSAQADEKQIEGIKEKTDEKGFLKFDDLDVAIYLLRPSDYAKYEYVQPTLIAVPTYEEGVQNSMEFDITVIPKHTPFKVEISKRDITTSEELEGAHLQVKDADGNIVDEWISGKEPHMIKNLYEFYIVVVRRERHILDGLPGFRLFLDPRLDFRGIVGVDLRRFRFEFRLEIFGDFLCERGGNKGKRKE